MKDMFGYEPPIEPKTARQMVRQGDPVTSTMAAETVLTRLSILQRDVYAATQTFPKGFTLFDIEDYFHDHGSTHRSRVAELVAAGLVFDSGRKKQQRGGWRTVWIAWNFK